MNKPLKQDVSRQASKAIQELKSFQLLKAHAIVKELHSSKCLFKGSLKKARCSAAQLSKDNPSKTYVIHNKDQYYCQFKAGTIHNKFNPVTIVHYKESSLIIERELDGEILVDKFNKVEKLKCQHISRATINKADSIIKKQANSKKDYN